MELHLPSCIFMVELPVGRKSCRGFLYQLVNLLEKPLSQETRRGCRSQTFRPARKKSHQAEQLGNRWPCLNRTWLKLTDKINDSIWCNSTVALKYKYKRNHGVGKHRKGNGLLAESASYHTSLSTLKTYIPLWVVPPTQNTKRIE